MCAIMEQFADKVKGTFSFFDRMIIDGYIRPLALEYSRAHSLYQLHVRYKDYTSFFMSVTEQIKERIEGTARMQGRPVLYLSSSREKRRT